MVDTITLRQVNETDESFLLRLYRSTRDEQLREMGWTEEHITLFVKMQFEAQTKHYRTHFKGDEYVVIFDNEPIGRIILKRSEIEILLVDMAVLTEHRNKGIGSHLMKSLIAEADREKKSIRLHVLKSSAAVRFYERHGFVMSNDDGLNLEMEHRPSGF